MSVASTNSSGRFISPAKARPDLIRLVVAQHAVVHENAGEAAANRAMDQQRCDGRIDAAAQSADDLAFTDLPPDARG